MNYYLISLFFYHLFTLYLILTHHLFIYPHCPACVQVLNLSHNPMGHRGMRKLQRFIVKATLLTHLDIADCQIGGAGLALLSEFFMCLPLRYLRVSDNDINDKGRSCMSL